MAELTVNYNQWVKSVEFFPFEWSANLLAVCLKDQVKIYVYEESYDEQVSIELLLEKLTFSSKCSNF